jgi:hypothetical protein
MQTPRKQLEFPTTASAFWEVSFEVGNDIVPTNVAGRPFGTYVFPASTQPSEGQPVLIHNSGGDTLIVGIWLYNSSGVWTRAPGYKTTDILVSPVIVRTQMSNPLYPTFWYIFDASGGAQIVPGTTEQTTTFSTQQNYSYVFDLVVPTFAKYICAVDVSNGFVTTLNKIACGFIPLEDPPLEQLNDYEELETMTISAIAQNGSIRFFLYARGAMTGSYRVWYTIN